MPPNQFTAPPAGPHSNGGCRARKLCVHAAAQADQCWRKRLSFLLRFNRLAFPFRRRSRKPANPCPLLSATAPS